MSPQAPFCDVETALEEIRAGRDEDRENEGDLTMAAEKITPEAINFMAKYGRGLVCLAGLPRPSFFCLGGDFLIIRRIIPLDAPL